MTIRVSNLWFGGDDWFILLDRRVSPGPGQLGLFEPHFEHWTTVPILVFRAFEELFGVREYWPYVLLLVIVHLAIVVLLWQVMVRAAIDPWLALGFTAVVAMPGVGFENLTNVWQVTLVSSVALGLGALLLLPERGPLGLARRRGVGPPHRRHGVLRRRHHHARRRRAGRARAPGMAHRARRSPRSRRWRTCGGTSRTGATRTT